MKKILALILATFLVFTLVACRTDAPADPPADTADTADVADDPADDPADDAADDPPPPAGGDNVITVWCWDPAFNLFAMEEAARIYSAMNPDFEIQIVEVAWDDIQTQIITAGTTGNFDALPDIMLVQDHAFQMNVMNFPEIFTDITDSGVPFGEFASAKVGMSMVDGRNFGVPFDNGTTIMALRTDILEEAGFTIDDFTDVTWAQFQAMGEQVLAATGMPMISTTAGGSDYMSVMLQSAGVNLFNEDGSPNIAGNDVLVEAIETYLSLVDSGVLLEVNNWDEYIGSFVNEIVVGTISGCWILGSIQTADDQAGLWGLTNIPRLDVPGGTNYSNWGGSSWAITANANVDLAVSFLRHTFAGSTELYDIILPAAGALATWAPAAESDVYAEPHEFFGGQTIFIDIIRFSGNVPSIITGIHYYEALDAIGIAVIEIIGGADIESALQSAQQTVEFQIN